MRRKSIDVVSRYQRIRRAGKLFIERSDGDTKDRVILKIQRKKWKKPAVAANLERDLQGFQLHKYVLAKGFRKVFPDNVYLVSRKHKLKRLMADRFLNEHDGSKELLKEPLGIQKHPILHYSNFIARLQEMQHKFLLCNGRIRIQECLEKGLLCLIRLCPQRLFLNHIKQIPRQRTSAVHFFNNFRADTFSRITTANIMNIMERNNVWFVVIVMLRRTEHPPA